MGNWYTPPPATKIRDFDRSFILFGKASSGKSTLGNLILWDPKFKVHKGPEAFGLTKEVQSGDTEIDPRIVYGKDCGIVDKLKIQVLDQPGCNDSDFIQENYCKFLIECIAESKGEMCTNFLILIKFKKKAGYLSPEEFLTILNIAEILSSNNYSFFSNAVLVFTHADIIDPNLNEDELEQELREIIRGENFAYIKELINLVDGRYIFINGANRTEQNRYAILEKLVQLTRPNLKVYINGYHGFPGNEFKTLFKQDPSVSSFESNLLKYDVEYQFNPDLNLFRKHDKLDIGKEISQALDRLSGIGKGVSVMILLVSLEETFNKEVYNLILNLPETYGLGDKFKQDFWDYACILFKGPYDTDEFVKQNIDAIPLLKEFVEKVKRRYSSVSEQTSIEECSMRILGLVRKVKLDTEGKTYIDQTVLAEMNNTIKDSMKQRRECKYQKQMLDNSNLNRVGIELFEAKKTPDKVSVSLNNFFLNQKYISPQIGYFILKNINPDKAEEFKAEYSEQRSVTAEEFSNYYHKALKK